MENSLYFKKLKCSTNLLNYSPYYILYFLVTMLYLNDSIFIYILVGSGENVGCIVAEG